MAQSTINGSTSSFGTERGYIKFPNGLEMCWGITASILCPAGELTEQAVSFPFTFTQKPAVFLTEWTGTSAAAGILPIAASSTITTTGFTVKYANTTSSNRQPGVYWFAIGY